MDAVCDAYLLNDPWAGDRANCASTEPDSVWHESCRIKTRELCHTYPCTFFEETNFGTGFGVRKTGIMTLDTVCVQEPAVEVNDLYVHVELFPVSTCDDLLSDMISWIASWVQEDLADFIGQTVKAQVETAYSGFAEDCP